MNMEKHLPSHSRKGAKYAKIPLLTKIKLFKTVLEDGSSIKRVTPISYRLPDYSPSNTPQPKHSLGSSKMSKASSIYRLTNMKQWNITYQQRKKKDAPTVL